MTSYRDALKCVLKNVKKKVVQKNTQLTKNSFLAKNVYAKKYNPAYNNSLLDGFVFKSSDTKNNKAFNIIGEVAVGENKSIKYKKNSCYKVSTGGKIFSPYDCMVPYEKLRYDKKNVFLSSAIKKFKNVRLKGSDFKSGKFLLKKNTNISTAASFLIKSSGNKTIHVYEKPKVVLFCSGDEITDQINSNEKVINSIPEYIKSLSYNLNFDFTYLGIVKDNKQSIEKVFNTIKKFNNSIIISTGGVSAGHKDFFPKFLKNKKYKTLFHRIKMQPGRPTLFAKKNSNYYFGLPGNPISTIVGIHFLITPLVLAMQNKTLEFFEAKLQDSYKKNKNMTEVRRGYVKNKEVKILQDQESYKLNNLVNTNCWLLLDQKTNFLKKGTKVKYIKYEN